MRWLLAVLVLAAASAYGDSDNFNAPLLDLNKWGMSEFSQFFIHTNGYISFESTNNTDVHEGIIYWKEKKSLSTNWSAKIQVSIDPYFVPSGTPISFLGGTVLNGVIEAGIGVTSDSTELGGNSYFNIFLKGHNSKTYFNPAFHINGGANTDAQFSEVSTHKVLMEIENDPNQGLLISRMFDYSAGVLGAKIGEDEFQVSRWGSVNEVYVVVGGDTWTTIAPQGSATLDNFEIVPEPSSLSLLLAGGAVFAAVRRRKVD